MVKIKWLDFEINEKIYKRVFIIGVVIVICYLFITFLSFSMPRNYKINDDTHIVGKEVVNNGIGRLEKGRFILQISGWAYKQGDDVKTFNSFFVLKNEETGKMYRVKTGVKDVPELQLVDGLDCLKCGLESQSIFLGMKKGRYELYIAYQNNDENLLAKTDISLEI